MPKRYYEVYMTLSDLELQGILDSVSRNNGYGIEHLLYNDDIGAIYIVVSMNMNAAKIIPSYKEIVILEKDPQKLQDRFNDLYSKDPMFYVYKTVGTHNGLLAICRIRNPDAFPELRDQILKEHGEV